MLPTVAAFLCYMKGLAPKGRKGLAFGSYGWGGQSIPQVAESLEGMGFELVCQPLKQAYVPSEESLNSLEETVFQAVK